MNILKTIKPWLKSVLWLSLLSLIIILLGLIATHAPILIAFAVFAIATIAFRYGIYTDE